MFARNDKVYQLQKITPNGEWKPLGNFETYWDAMKEWQTQTFFEAWLINNQIPGAGTYRIVSDEQEKV